MSIKIALAGNPNCGKTTLFNALTGANQYVGNWPGVTVEKKEGKLKGHKDVVIMDLPGIYSLSPYTLEEVVARNYLIGERPDAIINIIDGTNIERNLYLTTQIIELGIPVIMAVNMMDLVTKNGDQINIKALGDALGCEVVEISALKGTGVTKAAEKAVAAAQQKKAVNRVHAFSADVENCISTVEDKLGSTVAEEQKRFFAIKLIERDSKISDQLSAVPDVSAEINALEEKMDDDTESIITNERYTYITSIIGKCVKKATGKEKLTTSDKIDKIVTNRFAALPIFALIMFVVYYVSVTTVGAFLTDWTNDTLFGEWIIPGAQSFFDNIGCAAWLSGLIVDGIISGVGAVLGFVPQMLVLFIFLAFLEGCGYMARVAFIMDRIFRKFGLSGKSFIPMLIGTGCGVPGVMASRTIENERDRRMTIMTTTFIPCGAKLPIIALFAGAIFGGASWVAPSVYFLGIFMIIICGIILNKTKVFKGEPAPFVMELPQYHIPSFKGVILHMWDRAKAFIVKAGTIIFVACAVIWFTSSFSWTLQMVDAQDSILASIGKVIAPIFAPLGFGNWQSAVSTLTGFVAKENVVGTFGVLFGIAEAAEDTPVLLTQIGSMFTAASGLAFIAFNMLNAPCFAAIGAIRREMGSWKWMWITIGFQTLTAYIVALMINQIGSFILGTGSLIGAIGSVLIAVFAISIAVLSGRDIKSKKKVTNAN